MYKWLLDTNIIISGLFWSGNESKLLELAIANRYEAVICEFVIKETERIIDEKFPEMQKKAEPALEMLMDTGKKYPLLTEKEVIEFKQIQGEVISDKGDLVILATALKSEVDAIITGDNHLHSSEIKNLIEVYNAVEALEKIN